jgi:hypothetical protein
MKGPLANQDNSNQDNLLIDLIDFETLPVQSITLTQADIEQAIEISDRIVTEPQQWKTYLNALALFGVQEWLTEQVPDLKLNWQQCSLFKPQYANVIEAAYDLQVKDFKICLISTGGSLDPFIHLPRAVIDLPNFRAHLYLIVKVLEEQGHVQVHSFLSYDQWVAYQQANPVSANPDWSYRVPTEWFDSNLNRLLLQLQCLEAQSIPVSDGIPALDAGGATLQQCLQQRLIQAESIETPLWQLLTWEEGAQVLTHPEILNWLYQVQTGMLSLEAEAARSEVATAFLQPILDAGTWLQNELDEIAQSLGWILLPPLALRSPNAVQIDPDLQPILEGMEKIRRQLSQEDIRIPVNARCVYKDLILDGIPLEFYAIASPLTDAADQPINQSPDQAMEWMLLLVLKSRSEDDTHPTITLSVKDQTDVLVEHPLFPGANRPPIYAQVIGTEHEEFRVTLTSETGDVLALPPFTFRWGKSS